MKDDFPVEKKKMSSRVFFAIGIFIMLTACVLLIIFFLKGKTVVVGNWPDLETAMSFSCSTDNTKYPFFQFDDSEQNTTRINALFNASGISSISLVRRMFYSDYALAKTQSDSQAFSMNKSFGLNGLSAYSLNAKFSVNDDVAQMSLYAQSDELSDDTVKYFLLDEVLSGYNEYVEFYVEKGFECVVSEK